MKLIQGMAVLGMVAALGACQKETILQGERLDPRDVLGASDGAGAPAAAKPSMALSLPAAKVNADWPQRAGNAAHLLVNPAMGSATTLLWSAPIGEGAQKRYRITSDPVVGGGRVFTLDSHALAVATSTSGQRLWQADLTPPGESPNSASGGGIALNGAQLLVTTGFGELIALDAASGTVQWRQKFDADVGGAPTVSGGTIYVVARDGSAWAIRASDGKVQWQLPGVPSAAAMTTVASPAVSSRAVVFPFSSGDLVATLPKGGLQLWSSRVAGERLGWAYATALAITGDPVIAGNVVYAGTSAGRTDAFDLGTGERLWSAEDGALGPVQVAGGSVFLVSDDSKLVRLDQKTGATIWSVDLPYYVQEKVKKQNEIYVHYGPLLAGGRLFVASSDEKLRSFDPKTGTLLSTTDLPGGAASAPVVAGNVLYVLSAKGDLLAYR